MMTRQSYNKLVRDRIPEIIYAEGRTCGTDELPDKEYTQALKEKLLEEAKEVADAAHGDLVTELADLYEVIDALLILYQIDESSVVASQHHRRVERGGFERRLRLLWVE